MFYKILMSQCVLQIPPKRLDRFCEILCAFRVGLKVGQHLFFRPLNDKSDPLLNILLYFMVKQRLPSQLV